MKKYVIKNCPAYRTECEEIFNFLGSEKIFNACLKSAGISCKDITNCVMKRIVELCKDEECEFADEILQLLEIEECKNE